MRSELTANANGFVMRQVMPGTARTPYSAVTQSFRFLREAGGITAASSMFAFSVLLLPVTGAAQSPTVAPTRAIAFNPLMALTGYPAAEYEQRITANLTVGFAASSAVYSGGSSPRRTNLDAKVRLYPNEKAMEGFGIAGSLGVTNMIRTPVLYCLGECLYTGGKRRASAPNSTIELSYQWLLGSRKSTAIALGGGLRRIFASEANWGREYRLMTTARLNIGYAF